MSAAQLRAASPQVELAFLAVVGVAAVAGAVRAWRSPSRPGDLALAPVSEACWLIVVLGAALVWRTLFYASAATPRWFFPQTTVLHVAEALARGDLWEQWRPLLGNTRVVWVHDSAVMMPVAVAFQAVLGPSVHLPTLVGAFWGLVAVGSAWLLGRAVRGPVFGIAFAALVAASPLQITWARLGGLQIGASAHVLVVTWLAYGAGARAGVVRTLVTVGVAWASLYHYAAARVAIPLAAVAWLAGLAAERPPRRRLMRVLVVCGALAVAGAVSARRAGLLATLWPSYSGYVGSRGERTAGALLATTWDSVRTETPRVVRAYFLSDRARLGDDRRVRWAEGPLGPGMAAGGLTLVPFALLGLAGLVIALRHPRRDVLWLAVVVLGVLPALLGRTSARRLLVFDVGWCALGASALVALLGSRACAGLPSGRLAAVLGLVLALGTWSLATAHALASALGPEPASIPFAEAGFGDGRACPECVRRARGWQEEMARGGAVVLVDSDQTRENRTAPGGLALYGKIGALVAGRPSSFLQYYAEVRNFDVEPPHPGPLVPGGRTTSRRICARS